MVSRKYFPAVLCLCVLASHGLAQGLQTRWTNTITAANAHREYPRPQMVRKDWVNLNGHWDLLATGPHPTVLYSGKILVPFPVESALSGVPKLQGAPEMLAYTRTFTRPKGDRVVLHFGAVDWRARIL